jgi:hypothetical protein
MFPLVQSHFDSAVKWAPQIQAVLGDPGSFDATLNILFWIEVAFAVPVVIFAAFGRWVVVFLLLGFEAALPFAMVLGLFGLDAGRTLITDGPSQEALTLICATVLVPALAIGGFFRLIWFGFRAFLIRAPQDLRA